MIDTPMMTSMMCRHPTCCVMVFDDGTDNQIHAFTEDACNVPFPILRSIICLQQPNRPHAKAQIIHRRAIEK